MKKWFSRVGATLRELFRKRKGLCIGILAGLVVVVALVVILCVTNRKNKQDVLGGDFHDATVVSGGENPDSPEGLDSENPLEDDQTPEDSSQISEDSPFALGETVVVNDGEKIKTVLPEIEQTEVTLTYSGSIQGSREEEIYAVLSDLPFLQVSVKVGDVVKEGDVLATLDISSIEKLDDLSMYDVTADTDTSGGILEGGFIGGPVDDEDGRESTGAVGTNNSDLLKQEELAKLQEDYEELLEEWKALDKKVKDLDDDIADWIKENGDPASLVIEVPAENPTGGVDINSDSGNVTQDEEKLKTINTRIANVELALTKASSEYQAALRAFDEAEQAYEKAAEAFQEQYQAYVNEQKELKDDPSKQPTVLPPAEPDKTAFDQAKKLVADTKAALEAAETEKERANHELEQFMAESRNQNASSGSTSEEASGTDAEKKDTSVYTALVKEREETKDKADEIAEDLADYRKQIEELEDAQEETDPSVTPTPAPNNSQDISADNPLASATPKPSGMTRQQILDLVKSNSIVTASVDGVITAVNYKAGDLYGGEAIATIETEGNGILTVLVPQDEMSLLKNEQEASIVDSGKTYTGTVSSVTPYTEIAADGTEKTVVEVKLDSEDTPPVGKEVEVQIVSMEAYALTLPEKCIQKDEKGNTYVLLSGDISDYTGSVDITTGKVMVTVSEIRDGKAYLENGSLLENRSIVVPEGF